MTKIYSDFPTVTKELKKKTVIRRGKLVIQNKTYEITDVTKVQWKGLELICRRILGSLLTVLTLGIYLAFKNSKHWFSKTKIIYVSAHLVPNKTDLPTSKDQVNSTFLHKNRGLTLPPPPSSKTIDQNKDQTPVLFKEPIEPAPFEYFDKLPSELQRKIFYTQKIESILACREVSRDAKNLIDDALIWPENERSLIVAFSRFLAKPKSNPEQIQPFLDLLLDKPEPMIKMLCHLDASIQKMEGKGKKAPRRKKIFATILSSFINKNLFNVEYLSTLPPELVQKFLEASVRQAPQVTVDMNHRIIGSHTPLHHNLYLQLASHPVQMQFLRAGLKYDYSVPLLKKSLEAKGWIDVMRRSFDVTDPEQKHQFHLLFFECLLLDLRPQDPSRNAEGKLIVFSLIDETMPDLTLAELTRYLQETAPLHRYYYSPSENLPGFFTDWKAFKLFKSDLQEAELHLKLIELYQEGYRLCPESGYEPKSKFWKEIFLSGLYNDEDGGFISMEPPEVQLQLARRIVHTINGLGKIAEGLPEALINNISHKFWYISEPIKHASLKEWIHSYRNTSFLADFSTPFKGIQSPESLEVLLEEAIKFDEPKKNFFLKALGRGIRDKKISMTEELITASFNKYGLQVPDETPDEIEILLHSSALSSFFHQLLSIENAQQFDEAVKEAADLPQEQKQARLRVLAHGLPLMKAIPLSLIKKKALFKANHLSLKNFAPIDMEAFLEVEKRAFNQ